MKIRQRAFWLLFAASVGIGMHACSPPPAVTPESQPTPENSAQATPVQASPTLTQPEPTPTLTATPLLPSPTPTIFPPPGSQGEHFIFSRPVDVWVDFVYRYGSTHNDTRATHHGSDLLEECGVPVRAAADGEVVVAGGDWTEVFGPYESFYGNLVVVRHDAQPDGETIFTLYGHLSAVDAEVGDQVSRGDKLGEVGFSGAAIGCHLHFEVRIGENLYTHTRNPELWMIPYRDEGGTFYGAIAGRLMGMTGYPIPDVEVEIQRLNAAGEVEHTLYAITYADMSVNGDDAWGENFAVGDVAPGRYLVQFIAMGLHQYEVEVLPGQVTLINFDLRE